MMILPHQRSAPAGPGRVSPRVLSLRARAEVEGLIRRREPAPQSDARRRARRASPAHCSRRARQSPSPVQRPNTPHARSPSPSLVISLNPAPSRVLSPSPPLSFGDLDGDGRPEALLNGVLLRLINIRMQQYV